MYWRVRKLGPEQIARQYGVHAICIVSVLLNLGFMTRMSASKALNATQKTDYDKFARQVTRHLFDANYLTFEDSMGALANELGPTAMAKLRNDQTIPKDPDELKAISRQLIDSKSVSCVKFNTVEVQEPDSKGLLPVKLQAKIVVHDAQGVRPNTVALLYKIGSATNTKTKESHPVVVDLQSQFIQ